MNKPLLEVLRDVTLDPTEQAAFAANPSEYLSQYGYQDVPADDLAEAFSLVADTLPAEAAQSVSSGRLAETLAGAGPDEGAGVATGTPAFGQGVEGAEGDLTAAEVGESDLASFGETDFADNGVEAGAADQAEEIVEVEQVEADAVDFGAGVGGTSTGAQTDDVGEESLFETTGDSDEAALGLEEAPGGGFESLTELESVDLPDNGFGTGTGTGTGIEQSDDTFSDADHVGDDASGDIGAF